ncbi:MAG: hypothetical protein JWP61_2517 [Friedmanniella sp.]|nr:hypothetical protein [Friedmanniella sp.]
MSPLRRTAQIVLGTGSVLAVVAAFGPPLVVRFGVVVAVASAVVACLFAWREVFVAHRDHAAELHRVSGEHGRVLTENRRRNAAVVETLTGRIQAAGRTVDGQRITIAELRGTVSGLESERATLRGTVTELTRERSLLSGKVAVLLDERVHLHRELEQHLVVIATLRDTVRAHEDEIASLRSGEGEDASVHHMPRRALAEHEAVWNELPTARDLWADGEHPAVVDMKTLETAMVLPNYEGDRRVG